MNKQIGSDSPMIEVSPTCPTSFKVKGVFQNSPRSAKQLQAVGIMPKPQVKQFKKTKEAKVKGRFVLCFILAVLTLGLGIAIGSNLERIVQVLASATTIPYLLLH